MEGPLVAVLVLEVRTRGEELVAVEEEKKQQGQSPAEEEEKVKFKVSFTCLNSGNCSHL